MRIAVWPVDAGGCGYHRQLLPAQAISEAGLAEVIVDRVGPKITWSHQWKGTYPNPDIRVLGVEPYPADVVILQRPALKQRVELIPLLQDQGIKVVVDMDDRFDKIDKRSRAWKGYNEPVTFLAADHRGGLHVKIGEASSVEMLDRACQQADVVTVSTPALLSRYGYGKGKLCRNCVPESYLKVDVEKIPSSVGWSGSVDTHPGDLEATEGRVARALRGSGWKFHVAGTGTGVKEALRLDEEPIPLGWVPFKDHAANLAQLEVGIVPLAPTVFNESKSWLKASEFAALGIPAVASDTPENRVLNRSGVGVLAASPSAWERRLRQLLKSPEYRADLGGRSREAMARYTYEAHAEEWFDAWTSACVKQAA